MAEVIASIKEILYLEDEDEVDTSSSFKELGFTSELLRSLCSKYEGKIDIKKVNVSTTVKQFIGMVGK